MSNLFYRYLRPKRYNFDRNIVETDPRGGICLAVRLGEGQFDNLMEVAYSICHANDVFSKDTAKRIADQRLKSLTSYELHRPASLQTDDILHALIKRFDSLPHLFDEHAPRRIYMDYDLELAVKRIQEIWASIRAAEQLAMMDQDAIEALRLREFYEH